MLKVYVNHALGGLQYAETPMQTMGDRIRMLRNARNLSQEGLGAILGVSGATISQWESGATTGIRPEHFLKFCAFFDVDPYWVVFGDEGKPKISGPAVASGAAGRLRRSGPGR